MENENNTAMSVSLSLEGKATTSPGNDESDLCATNLLTARILEAQQEADEIADKLDYEAVEEGALEKGAMESILLAPKLLSLPQTEVVSKIQDMKHRGAQLDLLLLKAESYSHYIASNQKLTRMDGAGEGAVFSQGAGGTKKRRGQAEGGAKSAKKKKKGGVADGVTASAAAGAATGSPAPENPEDGTVLFKQPHNLVGGTLLTYQLEGVQWLLSLYENGLSGILADEMGLGKTIQVIGLVAQLRLLKTPGPFLIAGPLATLPNWINEFKKWLPDCPVLLYHGPKEERKEMRISKMPVDHAKGMTFPVVITSFEICMIDRPHLEKYPWQYIILDEGHRIKNRNCKLVKELKSLPSTSRLLLTGTPIQNTLEELWSLLNFCSPAIFDDLEVFESWFGFRNIGRETKVDEVIDTEQRQKVVTKLHAILRPFLLRRLKRDVLLTVPPKREIVVYCGMSSIQKEYYEHVQKNTLRETLMGMGIEGAKDSSCSQNPAMQLRKVCNHPFLFGEPRIDGDGEYMGVANPLYLIHASGKLKLMDRMLFRLKRDGHKVLIFSQMVEVLNILEDYLGYKNYKYCRLDGSTKIVERQEAIDNFNNDEELFVFLLSTRAGGLGINLTAADTCILFDSDWNPHQDSQAQDRCHRLGQKRPVVAYRLLTAGSVEIDMMEKQISKKKLERMTIQGGDYRRGGKRVGLELTIDRLRQLLEDDVKNLQRMREAAGTGAAAVAAVPVSSGGETDAAEIPEEISDEELDLIMNRQLLFPTASSLVSSSQELVNFNIEGCFYDVLEAAAAPDVLGAFE